MTRKQNTAIITPLILMGLMYPIFRLMAVAFADNWGVGCYFGLIAYWLIWGIVFPWLMIGKESIQRIVRPQKPNYRILLLVFIPLLLAGAFKFISGMEYDKPSIWMFLLLLSTCFGNGFFEELLWRGVYMELFPKSVLFRMVWPTIGFALWHYIPGSLSPSGDVLNLMIGAGLMGLYLSFLAKKTGTIWWTIVVHTIGGFIVII